MIKPAYLNLTICSGLGIFQNSDWSITARLSERVNCVDTPIDLTGYEGISTIKKYCDEDEPIVQPTVTITDAANGEFKVSLTAAQTGNIILHGRTPKDVGLFVYDVVLIKDGERSRVLNGQVEVSPAVTDADDMGA